MAEKEKMSEEKTPLDRIIARVDKYIGDPSLVDRKTLEDLKEELMDLRSFVDGEDMEDEEPEEERKEEKGKPSLVIAISKARRSDKK